MKKSWLKTQHSKNYSQKDTQHSWHPVSPLHIIQMREKWKQWQILFSWASKSLWTLTAATKLKHTCSLEGRKAMKNLHSVLKNRGSLCYRGLQWHSYDFASNHVQMCALDHKKGWMGKNWAFELWCLRRFLRVPYTTRRSNQSIWKEINLWPLLS